MSETICRTIASGTRNVGINTNGNTEMRVLGRSKANTWKAEKRGERRLACESRTAVPPPTGAEQRHHHQGDDQLDDGTEYQAEPCADADVRRAQCAAAGGEFT